MSKHFIKKLTLWLTLMGMVANANATIYTTLFTHASALDTTAGGHLGLNFLSDAPAGAFATLTYNSVSNVFTLSAASNLDRYFGADSFIDAIALNTVQPRVQMNDENVSGGGIADFVESTNDLPDFAAGTDDDFNILYRTATNTALEQGETVTFTIAGLNPNCLTSDLCIQNTTPLPATSFAIRIINNPVGNNNTAISWAAGASIDPVSAVAEAETATMFLAGLGLLSLASRRRTGKKINLLYY